tara:strand:+ start:377 stop:1156 length:780 start_codon:yes stop_codon:yes gene_type:complete
MIRNIIDSHTHLTENGSWMGTLKDASLNRLLEEINKAKVNRAVLIAIDGLVSNKFIEETYKKFSDLFWIFSAVNPLNDSPDKFINYFKTKEFAGIKIHPRRNNFSLKDDKVNDFFEKIIANTSSIFMVDCWFSEYDSDILVDETIFFVKQYPSLKIILAHSGGFKHKEIIKLAVNENIYLDTSYVLNTFNRIAKRNEIDNFMTNLKRINPSKIIFGSDFPEYGIQESIKIIEFYLDKYNFTQKEKEMVFSKNILSLMPS